MKTRLSENLKTIDIEQNELLFFLRYFISCLGVFGLSMVFKLGFYWREQENEILKWKALKNETDLKFLKISLGLIFLFNSINNIYSIAVENEDKSAPLLLEISKMLRYLIYKTDQERIPVEEELHFLNSLIKLYALRFDSIPFSEITYKGATNKQVIPPLLLFTLH